jgi:hypothetical protein
MSEVAGGPAPGERPKRHEEEEEGGSAEHLREDAGIGGEAEQREGKDDKDLIDKARDKLKGQ